MTLTTEYEILRASKTETTVQDGPFKEAKTSVQGAEQPQLEITEYTFNELTDILVKLEKENGLSTLEVFRKYLQGELEGNQQMEDWLDLFSLYLGTSEVQKLSCP